MTFQQYMSTFMDTATDFMANTVKHVSQDQYDKVFDENCRSVKAMTEEVVYSFDALSAVIRGGEMPNNEYDLATPQAALETLYSKSEEFATLVKGLEGDELSALKPTPFLPVVEQWPVAHFVCGQVMHICYHMGQIAYIQLKSGDAENHFRG